MVSHCSHKDSRKVFGLYGVILWSEGQTVETSSAYMVSHCGQKDSRNVFSLYGVTLWSEGQTAGMSSACMMSHCGQKDNRNVLGLYGVTLWSEDRINIFGLYGITLWSGRQNQYLRPIWCHIVVRTASSLACFWPPGHTISEEGMCADNCM